MLLGLPTRSASDEEVAGKKSLFLQRFTAEMTKGLARRLDG